MALDSIEQLSDDDLAVASAKKAPTPKRAPKRTAKAKSSPKKKSSPKMKSSPKAVEKTKDDEQKEGDGSTLVTSEPMPKTNKKTPSGKGGGNMKRPASALGSKSAASAPMKKPAGKGGRKGKDPDHVSVCKSKYKSNGVWSIKLWQKEVIRVKPHEGLSDDEIEAIADTMLKAAVEKSKVSENPNEDDALPECKNEWRMRVKKKKKLLKIWLRTELSLNSDGQCET
eukprot:s3309_g4.t1